MGTLKAIRPIPALTQEQESRFWAKVDRSASPDGSKGCWWWTAAKGPEGRYGHYSISGQVYYAHRVARALIIGDIDAVLDHRCDNGPQGCVNPLHLVPSTQGDNVLRATNTVTGANARKTHCHRGHEFTEANTIHGTNPNGRPKRTCRTCRDGYYPSSRKASS